MLFTDVTSYVQNVRLRLGMQAGRFLHQWSVTTIALLFKRIYFNQS